MKERCAAYGLRRKRALLQAVHTEEGEAGWLPLFYLCCFFSRRNSLLTYLCTPTERLSAVLRIFIYPIIGLLKKRRPKKRGKREMCRIWLAAKTCAFAGSSYRGGEAGWLPLFYLCCFFSRRNSLLTYLCTPTERLSAVLRIFIYPIIVFCCFMQYFMVSLKRRSVNQRRNAFRCRRKTMF